MTNDDILRAGHTASSCIAVGATLTVAMLITIAATLKWVCDQLRGPRI